MDFWAPENLLGDVGGPLENGTYIYNGAISVQILQTIGLDFCSSVVAVVASGAPSGLGLRRRGELELVPLHDVEVLSHGDEDVEGAPSLLDEALARGVLTFRQAWIIHHTRIADRPLTEVAASTGQSYEAVRQERRRGEALLRAFALGYRSSDSA